jgi:hypothetical protein
MRYPEIPVLSAIVVVLLFVPLPSQLRARNIATLTLIVSTFLGSIITIVNTLVWNGNTRNVAPVWCDIGQILHLSIENWPLTQRTRNLQPPLLRIPGDISPSVAACASVNIWNGSHRPGVEYQVDTTDCCLKSPSALSSL